MARKVRCQNGKAAMREIAGLQHPGQMALATSMDKNQHRLGRIEIKPAGRNMDACTVEFVFHANLRCVLFRGLCGDTRRGPEPDFEIGGNVGDILEPDRQADHVVGQAALDHGFG